MKERVCLLKILEVCRLFVTWFLVCSIRELQPVDATTNPSLILAAVNNPKFAEIVDSAIKSAKGDTIDEK